MRYKPLLQLVLMLMVGANLTLVCQGHIYDSRFEGPHLAMLPEAYEMSAGPSDTVGGADAGRVVSSFSALPGRSIASAQNAPEGVSTVILPAVLPSTVQEHGTDVTVWGMDMVLRPTSPASDLDTPPPRRASI